VNDDFITRLGRELRAAADREEQRSASSRAVLTVRTRAPRITGVEAVAALAVGAVLLVAVLVYAATRPEPAKPPPGPKVVARLTPGGALAQVVSGFGSAWVLDTTGDQLLRMNPATRRVIATIPLRASLAADVGPDAIWVSEGLNDLARIDPQTDRVVARIALLQGTSSEGTPVAIGDVVWVVGTERALRVDARTNRITKVVTVAHDGYEMRGATKLGGDLWVVVSNGSIIRLDGRTGARKATFRAPFLGQLAAAAGSLYLGSPADLARLDPATGRVLWRVRIDQIGAGAEAGGFIWLEASGRNGDRLVAVNPRDGRVGSTVHVGEFSVLSMQRIGSELWMATAGGHLVIVRL
jgi:outer membrane protein assembly factor BamB